MKFESGRVEALLTKTFGSAVTITQAVRLLPWFVVRCQLASRCEQVPPTVIVKLLRDGPSRAHPLQVCTEQAALEFVAELGLGLTPRLLASDLGTRLLITEDLAPRIPLAEVLQGEDTGLAAEGLKAFARALGMLHAGSSGHASAYYSRRRALGPVDPKEDLEWFVVRRWDEARARLAALGAVPSQRAEAELAAALDALRAPGGFLGFSNGDAEANNYLVCGGDGRLIDFEAAGYRHVLSDAVCLHVPGPLWLTVGDPRATGLEDAYRSALAEAVPEAQDDKAFGFGLAAACLVFALVVRWRFDKLNQRPQGDHSRLQMVSTLESAARAAEAHRSLPHLRGWTWEVAAKLRRIWPDTDVDLGGYASYTPRLRASE